MASVGKNITKLSHKCFRALLKKFRRKKKRQLIAKACEELELKEQKEKENAPGYWEQQAERERNAKLWEEYVERERERKHKMWLLREAEAQEAFQRKRQQQEKEKIKREEERKRILAEIEEKQLLENATLEKNKKEQQKKEDALQEALSSLPDGNGPWHNPLAPENYSVPSQETQQCQFYLKTGCCRFGDRCSRGHPRPNQSCTLLIKGMYSHISIDQADRDDYDTDMALEYEDSETYQDFKDFYNDVLPEFKKYGRVVQFKVCCNHEPHLRGNVYIQFSRESEALEACKSFNGRYYAGKQITCEFSIVTNWKAAVCGLYHCKRCPKGNNCNFLHVFKNPRNEFWFCDEGHKLEKYDRKDRSYVDYSSRSHRSHSNSSHSHVCNERREKHRRSSPHSRNSHRKKRHYSPESNVSGEFSYRTEGHKSNKHRRSRTAHKDTHKKKARHRSRSRSSSTSSSTSSSSSDEKYQSHGSDHKNKSKRSKKSSKRRVAASEDGS